MKPTFTRRIHRKAAAKESSIFRKNPQQEGGFFDTPAQETFFQPAVQRKCEDCEKEEKQMQRKKDNEPEEKEEHLQKKAAAAGNNTATSTAPVSSVLGTGGEALPASISRYFSSRMNADFSGVKVHTGREAHQAAKSINAQAFTHKHHLVFAEGKYQPHAREGKMLLAHELAHVLQQTGKNPEEQISRKPAEEATLLPDIYLEGAGTNQANNTAFGCANVTVQGQTDANYSNSFSSSLSQKKAPQCEGCEGDDCVTASGTLTSAFRANPTVTLPPVPSGLSKCEETAVRTFINSTLRRHELQHVAAFNTYVATIRTRISYTGCKDNLDAHLLSVHDGIEQQRRAASDAKSAALDPFNATIPCQCD